MRRENSKFNTAFLSHEGSKLFNNDYYGSAELDRFACYVMADGLDSGDLESQAAKVAVQAAIAAFHERPSIKRRALKRYIRAAHTALLQSTGHLSQRASIMMVVTDYQSLRYAWAGNTRFFLYRAGRVSSESTDHSLAQQMSKKGELSVDKIAQHEERDNLSRYAGQPGRLTPQISKKVKLEDGDIFVLVTRGVWEMCDQGDIRAAIDSAENHPNLALDWLERLLLDPHPDEIDNYSAAVVFADKTYSDPNREKKRKRMLAILIPTVLVLIVLTVVLVIWHNQNEAKRRNMQVSFLNAVEYVADENYQRADEELKVTIDFATQLKDVSFQEKTDSWRKFVDAVLKADELFAAQAYEDAQAAYLVASDRSRFTDNAGQGYIERRLALVSGLLSVRDMIALGDTLSQRGDYVLAEANYLDARRIASAINDAEGRKLALDALQNLYSQQDRENAQEHDQVEQKSQLMRDAVEAEAMGDKAVADVDLVSARLYYTIAQERFTSLDDDTALARIVDKLSTLQNTQAQNEQKARTAAQYVTEGMALYDKNKFVDAKAKYILARNIYSQIKDDAKLADVIAKIEQCDSRIR